MVRFARRTLLAIVALVLVACAPAPTPVGAVREPPPTSTAAVAVREPPQAATATVVGAVREPPPTPTPARLALASIPNPFERRQLAAGAPIAGPGLYFMDVATGAVEAWSLPGAKDAWYTTSPDNRWLIGYCPDGAYAADRQGGAAFRWGRNTPRLLAAQGEYLLFHGAGYLWIAGPGQPEPVPLPIGSASSQAVISPDGRTAAVTSGNTLYLVQLDGATCRAIGEMNDPAGRAAQSTFLETGRRGGVIVVHSYWQEGAASQMAQGLEFFSWSGERLGKLLPPSVGRSALSPDGRLIAWEEHPSQLTQAVIVADAATLAPRFRVLGATLCFHDFGSGDWLADSSALIVRTGAGYRLVTPDGRIAPAPAPEDGAGPLPDDLLPAPDRADLFAASRHMVVDAAGRPVAAAALPANPNVGLPADLSPWGLSSTELCFALPHLGHGGKCGEGEYLLPARVERPPFGPLVLAVRLPANDCVNLRATPGTKGQVLTCLPGGTRLSPAPLAELPQPEAQEPYYLTPSIAWAGGSRWLRVRAPDGQEGWVDAAAGQVGWVE